MPQICLASKDRRRSHLHASRQIIPYTLRDVMVKRVPRSDISSSSYTRGQRWPNGRRRRHSLFLVSINIPVLSDLAELYRERYGGPADLAPFHYAVCVTLTLSHAISCLLLLLLFLLIESLPCRANSASYCAAAAALLCSQKGKRRKRVDDDWESISSLYWSSPVPLSSQENVIENFL